MIDANREMINGGWQGRAMCSAHPAALRPFDKLKVNKAQGRRAASQDICLHGIAVFVGGQDDPARGVQAAFADRVELAAIEQLDECPAGVKDGADSQGLGRFAVGVRQNGNFVARDKALREIYARHGSKLHRVFSEGLPVADRRR
jgi:hypothetical protein